FPCSYESSQAPPTVKTLGGNGSNISPTKHLIIGNIFLFFTILLPNTPSPVSISLYIRSQYR
ncbi:MAG: hypothetical protein WCF23_01785, partial [Candidatus Nitrosopolaris sp.]